MKIVQTRNVFNINLNLLFRPGINESNSREVELRRAAPLGWVLSGIIDDMAAQPDFARSRLFTVFDVVPTLSKSRKGWVPRER